jgi:hypothetical protein
VVPISVLLATFDEFDEWWCSGFVESFFLLLSNEWGQSFYNSICTILEQDNLA